LACVDRDTLTVVFLVAAVALSALEIVMPGFVLLPFGLGAAVAALAGALGADVAVQVVVFLLASFAFFLGLRPLARRLNAAGPSGIGAERLVGATGTVLDAIAPHDVGLVRIDREEWRAEADAEAALAPGTQIEVIEVRGTRVVVRARVEPPARREEGTTT
jgi:membrane protein implicated in regulation of membrane protease activity